MCIGRPIPAEFSGFLCGIVHNLFSGHIGNKWHILDIWTGELFGRYRVHVAETAIRILESLLGDNYATITYRNPYLFNYQFKTVDLWQQILSV